jgi:hypothetical protein
MKKLTLILLILIGILSLLKGQTVDSIKVEQAGELIKIHYKILNSNQYQIFKVTVSAKINSGLESKLESLIGDVGDAVKGGKDNYIVIWDVLKDVDEVKSADFSVKAELVEGDPSREGGDGRKIPKRRSYLFGGVSMGGGDVLYGWRYGFMGSWGFSLSQFYGKRKFTEVAYGTYEGFSILVDVTKRIVNNKDYQIHLLIGTAIANNETIGNEDYNFLYGYNLGLVCGLKRLAITAGFSNATKPTMKNRSNVEPTSSFNLGIGIRF